MARWAKATERRLAWFKEHGPCAICGIWDNLELDHIDPKTKAVESNTLIWQSSDEGFREQELAKCQPLCHECHKQKTADQRAALVQHGTIHMYNSPRYKCRCRDCVIAFAKYQREYRRGRRIRTD